MNLDELNSAVESAVSSGRIGTPVSLRFHLQLADSRTDACEMLALLMSIAERAFKSQPHRMMARRNDAAEQLNVLFDYAGGQTCFVTCGRGSAQQSSLHLLLFGSRGIVRLEGGQLLESGDFDKELVSELWRTRVETSLIRNEAVPIG